ncbi:hypothetical protein SAMN06265348_103372 [Pedobacter westerhofensis]|uniref:Outer membrane protein beta-barrel domain-containing protein n=1 Tax=Pedobacter westerhofensis TaxID=425512 RepID=A0A521CAC9_9SPHI|nr:hypothetical protein [Pedobacter westerhofensis]SMO56373.1 hypothetical protein SAMN06265348_103372 [Pedobacter westerhofensis]
MFKPFKLLSFIALLSFCSCSSVYVPNVPNTPMLSSQGELSGGAHISLRGNANFNGAYAVSNHIGVLLGGEYMNSERRRKDFNTKMVEIGGGYFTTFGPDQNRILEIYAGVGTGKTDRSFRNYDSGELISSEVQVTDFSKTFVQVNYSSKKNKNFHLFGNNYPLNYGTALRVSHLSMDNFFINGVVTPKEDNIYLEPIFFTRMRLSDAVQLQYTTSSNIGLKNRKYMTAGNSIFSVGAVINVGGLKKKK